MHAVGWTQRMPRSQMILCVCIVCAGRGSEFGNSLEYKGNSAQFFFFKKMSCKGLLGDTFPSASHATGLGRDGLALTPASIANSTLLACFKIYWRTSTSIPVVSQSICCRLKCTRSNIQQLWTKIGTLGEIDKYEGDDQVEVTTMRNKRDLQNMQSEVFGCVILIERVHSWRWKESQWRRLRAGT